MSYHDFLIKQQFRSDYLGHYAIDVISSRELVHFSSVENHLDYILEKYPEDANMTMTVLVSWIEFSYECYMSFRNKRELTSLKMRDIRSTAEKAYHYLQLFWEEYFSVYEGDSNSFNSNVRHQEYRQWIMTLQELEIQYRFEETKRGIYLS